jgi:hypothetical protein
MIPTPPFSFSIARLDRLTSSTLYFTTTRCISNKSSRISRSSLLILYYRLPISLIDQIIDLLIKYHQQLASSNTVPIVLRQLNNKLICIQDQNNAALSIPCPSVISAFDNKATTVCEVDSCGLSRHVSAAAPSH